MENIGFDKFAEFILKKEKQRANFVKRIINQGAYKPEQDFYLKLRMKLIWILKKGKDITELNDIVGKISSKKLGCYSTIITAIKDFLSNKKYQWIDPPKECVTYSGLELRVNPEIGLLINDTIYFIKLHLKKDEINLEKAKIMEKIMQDSYKNTQKKVNLAVWDIQHRKFYSNSIEDDISLRYDFEKEAFNWKKQIE